MLSSNLPIVVLCVLCLCHLVLPVTVEDGDSQDRESRKLFGGYRITPRFCKATKEISTDLKGPTICMFNHECVQRNGLVAGACMDGFLFGTCCQLPDGVAGELAVSELTSAQSPSNSIQVKPTESIVTKIGPTMGHITSSGVSQITNALLGGLLPTAQDNAVVQIDTHDNNFVSTGVTHPVSADTIIQGTNDIDPNEFKPIKQPIQSSSTIDTTLPSLKFTVTSKPQYILNSIVTRPVFRPKPSKPSNADKYVLVPTISHETKPNKTQELESIVNIIQMLNTTAAPKHTTQRFVPSKTTPIYISSTSRPVNSKKPSTALFSSTIATKITTKEPSKLTKPTKKVQYIQSSTFRPVAHSTFANSPEAIITKKPSTSYVYSSTISKRPTTQSSPPPPTQNLFSSVPSPPPTVIVLSTPEYPTPLPSPKPSVSQPQRKPVTQVTINQHITNHIYSSSERPSPTVLITPKPSSSTTMIAVTEYDEVSFESETSSNDDVNFPPVRNPNLNMSALPSISENDITTPVFIEDAALNITVESFVNKIIQGLQEPFHGLKDIVYDNVNKTGHSGTTTKKPPRKTGVTTKKPSPSKVTVRSTSKRPTTSIVTKKPTTTGITKKTKPTKKTTVVTTTENVILDEPLDQDYRSVCGLRPLIRSGRIVGGKEAIYGEFPWQVLVRESTWLGLFTKNKCGGVLISNRYVMTAAHCQPGFLASLVAVFGEFDISGHKEEKIPLSRNIKRVIVHRQYDPNTFANDLALLELDQPVHFDKNIIPICLPREGEDFTGRVATVTGWGRLKYGGGVPSILQEVQVPIMENEVCQKMFQTVGHTKIIYESFLCAGYANGQKDSCEGDSGGPLVLQRPDGRYQLAGTVSHGIKCAAPFLPGVYMRTSYYKPWIESITGVH